MGLTVSLVGKRSGSEVTIMADVSGVEGRKTRHHSLQRDIVAVTSACEACKGLVTGEEHPITARPCAGSPDQLMQ